MRNDFTRREWLFKTVSAASGAYLASAPLLRGANAPSSPVAVARCKTYESSELLPVLSKMFDQLGGLGRIVGGKTVAIKINMTGAPSYRVGHLPLGDTHYTNPRVLIATVHLMGRAGAKRIRVLESPWSSADPVEESMLLANWEPLDIQNAAPKVEFENTNNLGRGKKYSRFKVPFGGYLYPAYDLNHSYEDCDVFVSLTKMKEHETTGFTLSMKNCFGITPVSIYGNPGDDEPNENPKGGRGLLHGGHRQPPKSSPQEKDFTTPRQDGYRVPRAVVDLVASRPVDLAIVDGIKTLSGGEGPWAPGISVVSPGIMLAGTNPVNTDAIGLTLMGLNPFADRGTHPFETSDNMLRLAEEAGVGTRDPKRIEVVGTPLQDAIFHFTAFRRPRRIAVERRA